jgi:2-polyprenyl-6-hydroxyphenyl methylase/3-demethylubiquinone-9 3-methyltransferase
MPDLRIAQDAAEAPQKPGDGWERLSRLLDERRIQNAMHELQRFLGLERLDGKRFLDIGCRTGLHSLAALRLGASHVTAVDVDPESVAMTNCLLTSRAGLEQFECRQMSIFDADAASLGRFDVVHSWGSLHHTGAMHEAIARAAKLVHDDGLLALAVYRRTVLCGFWKIEKRAYSRMPPWLQRVLVMTYVAKSRVGCLIRRRDFRKEVVDPARQRGKDYQSDVHEWLGNFPYESLTPREFSDFVEALGFRREHPDRLGDRALWTLSSGGCQEIRFRKAA